MMHLITQFVESQRQQKNVIYHLHKFMVSEKVVTLCCTQTSDHHQEMEIVLNGKRVYGDEWLLGYELKDQWLLIHSAKAKKLTTSSCLINIRTHEQRILTNVEGGWRPSSDTISNTYRCLVDFKEERVYFQETDTLKTFQDVFA